MINQVIKKLSLSLILSIIFVPIGYLIAIPISNFSHDSIKDVMFLEGLATTLITLFCTIQGNPSAINLLGLGDHTSQFNQHANLEATRSERQFTNYFKNFTNHSVVKLTFNSLTIVFGGILMILLSMFL
jgi:hypothetical protein